MKVFLVCLLFVLVCDSCHAEDLIYTSIGVIDPNQYVNTKNGYSKPEAHSRKKRSTAFTSSQEQAILDKHNELRSGVSPEAADMNFMVWDEDLATLAQEWSETCTWDHGTPNSDTVSIFNPYGQNLWLGSGTADNQPDGIGATQAWYNEVSMYTYDTRECTGVCGHYTQVVWADSYALGCGIHFCEETSEGQTNAWIMTCHYGPAGNYPRDPYVNGPSCTKCSSGSGECYNNQCRLCSDHDGECDCRQQCENCGVVNATCYCECQPYFVGVDCSVPCVDEHRNCRAGWYPAQCPGYDFVREGCPLMCGLCTERPGDFECEDSEPESNSTTVIPVQMSQIQTTGTTVIPVQMSQIQTTADGCNKECYNDGTINSNTCECKCAEGFQGDTCEEDQNQIRNGVELVMQASISVWNGISSTFMITVSGLINDACNMVSHYERCCPSSGEKVGGSYHTFVGTDDIFLGYGFPVSLGPNSFEIVIYVVPNAINDLCMAGSLMSRRKRSEIEGLLPNRMKRFSTVYLAQDVLYELISENSLNISSAVGVPIIEVRTGIIDVDEEEEDDDDNEKKDGGISDGVLAAIVVVVVIVVMVIIIAGLFFVFKQKKPNTQVGVNNGRTPAATKDDMNIKDIDT